MLTLNVRYELTTTPPDPNNLNGANVQFALANGNFTFKAMGVSGSGHSVWHGERRNHPNGEHGQQMREGVYFPASENSAAQTS